MNYQDLELLKQSREYKAAEALTDAMNSLSWSPDQFAKSITVQHRTMQQVLMKTFVATVHQMANDDYGYDDRNRASHEAAKKIVSSGILDNIYLPFI